MAASEQQKKFFKFLQRKQSSKKTFTEKEVEKATGWSDSTFPTYLAKGQLSDYVTEQAEGVFIATNVLNIELKDFVKQLSQSKHQRSLGHKCKSPLARALLQKSRDNMYLALELYNRPSLVNKLDGFVMLFSTAWEQLLKSILIERDGEDSIFVKNNKKGRKESISLRDGLNRYFEGRSLIKKNIETVVDLRDQAVHLLVQELQGVASRIFQSGIFNFSKEFEKFSDTFFINNQNVGMVSLVGSFELPSLSVLNSHYGEAAKEILSLAKDLESEIDDSDDIEFAIPLNVNLVFSKKDGSQPEIILAKADSGMEGLNKAYVISKTSDLEETHPYLTNQAIDEINKRLIQRYNKTVLNEHLVAVNNKTQKKHFNSHDFKVLMRKLKYKNSNNEFHYGINNPEMHRYSERAIEAIIEKVMSNESYLSNLRK